VSASRVLVAALLVLASSGCGPRRTDTPESARHREGARLYRTYCGLCHGDEGEGYVADNANALTNQDFLASVTDEFLHFGIANGRPGTPMAPYARHLGGPLASAEIDAIVAFLRSYQHVPSASLREGAIAGDSERARPVYEEHCASCHGDHGQGRTAVSLRNPEFLAHASDGQIGYAIAQGRRDTPMPGFQERLPEASLDDLVALIRSWQTASPVPTEVATPAVDAIVIHPEGPPAELELRERRFVPGAQVARELERGARMVILDARPVSNWLESHIAGAVPAPYYDVESIIERLPRDGTWIVAYCACPHAASGRVKDALEAAGFPNTAVLDEGVLWWEEQGYPMEGGPAANEAGE